MGLQIIKPDTRIDFMKKRKLGFVVSSSILLLGIFFIFFQGGLKLGIDFAGGVNIQISTQEDVQVSSLNDALNNKNLPQVRVQSFGRDKNNGFLLRMPETETSPEELRSRVQQSLQNRLEVPFQIHRLEMVGPKVGSDLKSKALQALFYAVLLISIYISGRFEQKWVTAAFMAIGLLTGLYFLELLAVPLTILILGALAITLGLCWYLQLNYALGAVVALIHDVLITACIFTFLGKDFDLTTVAALLTIIGYSLNDTIVIFDRIRENLSGKLYITLQETINRSVNQTLSRTLITSLTTLIMVLALCVLGGGVIHDFAVALLIGVLSGTYSSIFIASPLLLGIGPSPEQEEESQETVQV